MSIRLGEAADLPKIRHLLRSSRSYLNAGLEDLPNLLNNAITVVGEDKGGELWGFLAFQIESRPATLPARAATRVSLRGAAVVQTLFGGPRLPRLINALLKEIPQQDQPLQLFALPAHSWLGSALQQSGFREVDQIRFYVRTQRELPILPGPAQLRPVQEADLDPLALLDSETFDPLWHMGRADLLQLCFTARVQVAEIEGQLVGYTATAVYVESDHPFTRSEAQIVRIAVHPSRQGQGIGRQLLVDSIVYAHSQAIYQIQLNTQESNKTSQRLYESFQFRAQGKNVPVLILNLPGGGDLGSVTGD
ncbi:MAG: GNAT family N-acetyltransferase [Caldilineaceae bacterium]|nr:GNAT family N-acetyltransferase [Caldilineaceae bacterium]